MKVAINECFGGFGISNIALKELAIRNAACVEAETPIYYYNGNDKISKNSQWEEKWIKRTQHLYRLR